MYNDDDVKNKQKPWPTCQAPELKHVYWYIYTLLHELASNIAIYTNMKYVYVTYIMHGSLGVVVNKHQSLRAELKDKCWFRLQFIQ